MQSKKKAGIPATEAHLLSTFLPSLRPLVRRPASCSGWRYSDGGATAMPCRLIRPACMVSGLFAFEVPYSRSPRLYHVSRLICGSTGPAYDKDGAYSSPISTYLVRSPQYAPAARAVPCGGQALADTSVRSESAICARNSQMPGLPLWRVTAHALHRPPVLHQGRANRRLLFFSGHYAVYHGCPGCIGCQTVS